MFVCACVRARAVAVCAARFIRGRDAEESRASVRLAITLNNETATRLVPTRRPLPSTNTQANLLARGVVSFVDAYACVPHRTGERAAPDPQAACFSWAKRRAANPSGGRARTAPAGEDSALWSTAERWVGDGNTAVLTLHHFHPCV